MSNSIASVNGMSIIMFRVSSTESFVNQNLPIGDFDQLKEKKEILIKMTPNKKKNKNQQR